MIMPMQSNFLPSRVYIYGSEDPNIIQFQYLTQSSTMNQTVEEEVSSWSSVSNKRSPRKVTQPHIIKDKMNIDSKNKLPSNKASQEQFIVKDTFTIEPNMMGLVIGRKGHNLKRLEEMYGVVVRLFPRGGSLITVEGPAERVFAAKKDIEQNLSCKTNFFIKKDCIGLVIGQDGDRSRAMEDALNVKIVVRNNGEVQVTGKRCEEAKKAIEEKISCETSFFVEKDYIHLLIGQEGKAILALSNAHNVRIDILDDGEVVITGKEVSSAKRAIEAMIEGWKTACPFEEKFSVPARLIGCVKGKGGSNVKRIELNYGVYVQISSSAYDDSKNTVIGSVAENVSAAKQYILESLGTTILYLDESLVERVIAQRGETVRRINKEYGVVIHFEQKNQEVKERREVYIFGAKSRTKAAKDDIISIITGRKKV